MKIISNYKYTILLAGLIVFQALNISLFAQESSLDKKLMKGKKILIVYGGWDGHKPKEFVNKITPWLKEEGAELIISDSLEIYLNTELMLAQDLIIQAWTAGTITKEQWQGLSKAIRSGVGFTGIHGGIGDSFRETTETNKYWDRVEFFHMVGGIWVAHPGNTIEYIINIADKNDDVMLGINDYEVKTEQYYMHIDPNVNVLATTTFSGDHVSWIEGAVMPVVWKKYYYEGRVFYFSVGHHTEDLDNPTTWKIMQRGFRWASESKYQPKEEWLAPVYKHN